MNRLMKTILPTALLLGVALVCPAAIQVQCPGDINGDCVPDPTLADGSPNPAYRPEVKCMHLAAGDGFVTMADGTPLYIFGFADITGMPQEMAMHHGMLGANFVGPTLIADEGDDFYLNLTNVGMAIRPDLFDSHTVHFHGFPQAAPVFDGMPDGGIAINMGATLPYYYKIVHPGTYMYHCHVEATEHMQMGMLANLYVRPKQNKLPDGTSLNGFVHHTGYKYAYNDGDGSTYYDAEFPIQMGSFDPDFHNASESVQPLPFALMRDRYAMLNGRGYPDTTNPNPLPPPVDGDGNDLNGGKASQLVSSLIEARTGQKVLLRLSNLNVTNFYTLASPSIPMKVVGHCARLLRGPDGKDLTYVTTSATVGSGESVDAILDLAGVAPGTYVLHTSNLNFLSNDAEDFGGMMTEIHVLPGA